MNWAIISYDDFRRIYFNFMSDCKERSKLSVTLAPLRDGAVLPEAMQHVQP